MTKINNVIQIGIYSAQNPKSRFYANISPENFRQYFFQDISFDYVVDNENKDAINQLYYWLNKDKLFNGDCEKGILLSGAIGSGKTTIMKCLCNTILLSCRIIFEMLPARNLQSVMIEKSEYYSKRPLFIDDIGKEPVTLFHYGTELRPFEDLIDIRYRKGGITLGTTNLTIEDMQYTKHAKDRIKEMFNIIVLPGKSRR